MASCSNSALKSLTPVSRSTWSSDPGRPPKDGAPSCVTIHRTSQPWIYSLPRPLASTCSTPSSSCDWPAEISSGSTSHLIRPPTGSRAALPDPRSGSGLWRCRQASIASHGHPRQTYCSRLALAERLCRKTDRIDPTRVRRPCDRLGRGAPTPDSASLCPLLQRSENAPLVGQRCAILAPGAADRKYHVTATPRRIASPLHPSLSFRYTQKGTFTSINIGSRSCEICN